MDKIAYLIRSRTERGNEVRLEVAPEGFRDACMHMLTARNARLRLMFGADEREARGAFGIHAVFAAPGVDVFYIVSIAVPADAPSFASITPLIPAAHWYEREIADMLGVTPEGHPDPRRLVLHDSFPKGIHPLRRDFRIGEQDLAEWGEGLKAKVPYEFFRVDGEGVHEIPVGPVHAGIIEPGHFRFSVVGETIFYLEPRLFYKHKGVEKQFERLGFAEGMRLAERVSGTASFAHGAAYAMAVERMTGTVPPERALAVRTLLIELERIYNHIGDFGNVCAGTSLAVGYHAGAIAKERLMQLGGRLTGSRYLRGVNAVGGVTRDVLEDRGDILKTLELVERELRGLDRLLDGTLSQLDRVEGTGRLSWDIALKLGATGVTAKGSGVADDLRFDHPHLLYPRLQAEAVSIPDGDVNARNKVRVREALASIGMVRALLDMRFEGPLAAAPEAPRPLASALGYAEGARGSIYYFVMAAEDGSPLRVKLRSPSFCNWPVVPFAVHGNIVPDFPLCNKSFNLSYSGCDM